MIGVRPEVAEQARAAAVPAILSGLIGVPGNTQGTDSMIDVIAKQGSGGFDSLSTLIGSDPKGAATAGPRFCHRSSATDASV